MDTSPGESVLFFADKMERTKVNYSINLLAIYEKNDLFQYLSWGWKESINW